MSNVDPSLEKVAGLIPESRSPGACLGFSSGDPVSKPILSQRITIPLQFPTPPIGANHPHWQHQIGASDGFQRRVAPLQRDAAEL